MTMRPSFSVSQTFNRTALTLTVPSPSTLTLARGDQAYVYNQSNSASVYITRNYTSGMGCSAWVWRHTYITSNDGSWSAIGLVDTVNSRSVYAGMERAGAIYYTFFYINGTTYTGAAAPSNTGTYWFKISRSGTSWSAYFGYDGNKPSPSWTQINSTRVDAAMGLPNQLLVYTWRGTNNVAAAKIQNFRFSS